MDQLKDAQNELVNNCKVLLGKNLATKYTQEQRWLEFEMEYFSTVELGKNEAVKNCYDKARNAIFQLGYALDKGILDDEGSMLLDFAMMDYTREINELNNCHRCLLCRKHKKLSRSHICPLSIIKEIAKASNEDYDPRHPGPVTSMTGRHDINSPKTETKWLLCGTCEQLLSRHGEAYFVENFFRLLYPKIKCASIHYNQDLYGFCAGMAFRALSLLNFSYINNTTEIYDFFVACRNHLISLSGEESCHSQQSSKAQNKPEFFIFRNPVEIYSTQGVREEILSTVLQSNFQVHISSNHLQTGDSSPVLEGCFLIILLGGITILTKFSPDQDFVLPQSFVPISIGGGEYTVPDEVQRWTDIPPGVLAIFKESMLQIQSRLSEVFWGRIPIPNRHKSKQIAPSWDTEVCNRPDPPLPNALKELQQDLLSGMIQKEVTVTNLLPQGFNITGVPPDSTLTLPPGYTVLRHVHDKEKDATVLLCADTNVCYNVDIVVVHRMNQTRLILYGFRLHKKENEEQYIMKFLMKSSCEGANSAFFEGVVPQTKDVIFSLCNDFGCFQGIIHHSEVQRYVYLMIHPCNL